ncbi:hypothetical protein, partial [Nonomuraea zeae]
MPRHALGRLAAAFAVLVIAAGVLAWVAGDARFIALLVYGRFAERAGDFVVDADHLVMLVLIGLLHAWVLGQLLPGRRRGEKGPGHGAG